MICAVITGPSLDNALQQIEEAQSKVELLEFRLDCFDFNDQIDLLKKSVKLPVIFTPRLSSKKLHANDLLKLAELHPDYIDLEDTCEPKLFEKIKKNFPNIKLICSYHNFEETNDLDLILSNIKNLNADIYKIATYAQSSLDSLRMLKFIKANSSKCKLIGLCMGQNGHITRLIGHLCGNLWTYSCVQEDESSKAIGQIDLNTLLKIYNFRRFNLQTKVLTLIGGNVSLSKSHITHNVLMHKLGINGLFTKLSLQSDELPNFFSDITALGFHGLAVTMPLKEDVLNFLSTNQNVKEIGSANTLLIQSGKIDAINTDGIGALKALQETTDIKDKKIVLLGAGGVAKAIAYELSKRGGQLLILNRTIERAKILADKLGCRYGLLSDETLLSQDYDILINCTSVGRGNDELPLASKWLQPNKIVMDVISFPQMTPLLKAAQEKKCTLVYGKDMFMHQAIYQFKYWFNVDKPHAEFVRLFNEI